MPNPFIWVRRVADEYIVSRDGQEVCRFEADAPIEAVAEQLFEAGHELGERVGHSLALAGIRASLGFKQESRA
jgi:hypothetical protein